MTPPGMTKVPSGGMRIPRRKDREKNLPVALHAGPGRRREPRSRTDFRAALGCRPSVDAAFFGVVFVPRTKRREVAPTYPPTATPSAATQNLATIAVRR
jgi:hypothetical protein